MTLGNLVLRLTVGLLMAAHGAQKLLGWFGGPGLTATVGGFGGMLGLRPARLWVTVLTVAEVVGGLLMAIGLLGPVGPLAVAGAMLSGGIAQIVSGRTIGDTDIGTALVAVPGTLVGLAVVYAIGVRREQLTALD